MLDYTMLDPKWTGPSIFFDLSHDSALNLLLPRNPHKRNLLQLLAAVEDPE